MREVGGGVSLGRIAKEQALTDDDPGGATCGWKPITSGRSRSTVGSGVAAGGARAVGSGSRNVRRSRSAVGGSASTESVCRHGERVPSFGERGSRSDESIPSYTDSSPRSRQSALATSAGRSRSSSRRSAWGRGCALSSQERPDNCRERLSRLAEALDAWRQRPPQRQARRVMQRRRRCEGRLDAPITFRAAPGTPRASRGRHGGARRARPASPRRPRAALARLRRRPHQSERRSLEAGRCSR